MQKNQKILTILIGTILLVSMIATGTSASPMASGAEALTGGLTTAQFSAGSAGISCSACHAPGTSLEELARRSIGDQPAYLNLYSKTIYTNSNPRLVDSGDEVKLSQEAVYTLLTQHHPEQSMRLENTPGQIVQCRFCHTGESERAYLPIGKSD
jgi:hypothetical protein